jgi:aspartate/methionine/tyrosine aminotransferase
LVALRHEVPVRIETFALERFFAHDEFAVKHLLSASDCAGPSLQGLLELADQECLSLWHALSLGYTDTRGHPLLRAEISSMYRCLTPEDILVVTPEEGIFLAMNVLLQAGDHVVCTAPAYQSLHSVARALGCTVDFWDAREHEGWRFSLDDLARLLRDDTRLLIVNFPHNPTGSLPSATEWSDLLSLAADRGLRVFSDEMYRLLELRGCAPLPSAPDVSDRALCLFGMSKTFGLPGLRIGWLATQDRELLAALEGFRDYTTICSSAPSEILALIGLRAREVLIREHRARVEQNLALLERFVARHAGRFTLSRPQAGTVCLLGISGESASSLSRRAREQCDLLVLPSAALGMDDRHVRVGLGRRDFPDALQAFDTLFSPASQD